MKHLKRYLTFINEQDMMGMDPSQAPATPTDNKYKFIFMGKDEEGDNRYPNGTSSKKYQSYEILKSDLDSWIDSNIISKKDKELTDAALKIKKEAITDYIKGEKDNIPPDSLEFISNFMNQVKNQTIGSKLKDIEITFFEDGSYGSDEVDITIIITPEKK